VSYSINNSGITTGLSTFGAGGGFHAFRSNGTGLTDLALSGAFNYGAGINDSGQITGGFGEDQGYYHPFFYNGSTSIDLGTLGGSYGDGIGINSSGNITGEAQTAGGIYHAFLWNGSSMRDLGTLGGSTSIGKGINSSGQIVGNSDITGNGSTHAFLYDGTGMHDLGTLGGTSSGAEAMNASGEATGFATTSNGDQRAFLYDGRKMINLGTLGGSISYGKGINSSGMVVGRSQITGSSVYHGFLYTGGTMFDLNNLVIGLGGVTDIDVQGYGAINDSGQIGATGFIAGQQHVFLLTPVAGTGFSVLENWRQRWFGTTSNSGNAADTADPYGNGLPNLAVFALLGPAQDPSTASINQLPQVQRSGGNLLYSFTEPTGVSGITYGAEWSATLQSDWQPVPDTGTAPLHVFSVPIGSNPKLFLRLRVTEQ